MLRRSSVTLAPRRSDSAHRVEIVGGVVLFTHRTYPVSERWWRVAGRQHFCLWTQKRARRHVSGGGVCGEGERLPAEKQNAPLQTGYKGRSPVSTASSFAALANFLPLSSSLQSNTDAAGYGVEGRGSGRIQPAAHVARLPQGRAIHAPR